jgi:type II secretory pathway component PulF
MFKPKTLSLSEQSMSMKRLSYLLEADIPLHEIMRIFINQSHKRVKPRFELVFEKIKDGHSFSASLEPANLFSPYVVQTIRAGESTGLLKETILYIVTLLERKKALTKKITSALVYPFVILLGTVGLSLFLLIVIVPKIQNVFSSMSAQLPMSTQLILSLSQWLQRYGLYIFVLLIFTIFLLKYIFRIYQKIRYMRDALFLRIPIIGKIIQYSIIASFFRMLGTQLKTNVSLDKALLSSGDVLTHEVYKAAIPTLSQSIASGETISKAMSQFPVLFPSFCIDLIEIAETSGSLSNTFLYLANLFDQEIEDSLKIMTSIIEPALMAIMGLTIGLIALSIITPLYGITQHIKS